MLETYAKEVLVKGVPTLIRCVDVDGVPLRITGAFPRIVSVEDEWFDELKDPVGAIKQLKSVTGPLGDILSFWNPIPASQPAFALPNEAETVAVLELESFERWWSEQINAKTRNLIRKAEKKGVVVRECAFDDRFVDGMTKIFNECQIRQGRRFWHFGKNETTVREQFSRFAHRETMVGAYVEEDMIGFMMLGHADRFAVIGQILSLISERDKSPNNALMAKAVELCIRRNHEFLVYGFWGDSSLATFKRHSGFTPRSIPHYFVPLSKRGSLALHLGLHRGWKSLIPSALQSRLRGWRARLYEKRAA